MNLFRAEEDIRRWALFDPASADGIISLPDLLRLFGTESRRHLLDGDYLARWAGHVTVHRFGQRVGLTAERLASVERRFERWGGLLVIITRCLLTGLALPTNLVAGAGGYPLARFMAYSLLGEAIWSGQLVTLGWLYGANWVALLSYLEDATSAITGLAVAGVIVYVLLRLLRPARRVADEQRRSAS